MAEKKDKRGKDGQEELSYLDILRKKVEEKEAEEAKDRESEEAKEKLLKPEKAAKKPKASKDSGAKPKAAKKVEEENPDTEPKPPVVDEPKWKATIKDNRRTAKVVEEEEFEPENKKKGSLAKRLIFISLSVVLFVGLVLGGYFFYLQTTYSRIADTQYLEVKYNQMTRVAVGGEYSISTFNIGFGAYGQSYSFFMDEGEMLDGTKTKGQSARAFSEEDVYNNTNGAIGLIKSKAASDFYFFQEVDTDSTRSYYVNQVDMLNEAFAGYASIYAQNAHSKYLFYPLNDPIGRINSGILTLSKYNVDYSVRRSLVVDTGLVKRLFDLDRCFSVTKAPIYNSSKYLVLVNVHLSAYDEGNIRQEQIKALYEFMDYEYNKNGNYVVVGGDFNLCLAGEAGIFNNGMKTPGWCQSLPEGYTEDDFKNIGYSLNYDLSATIGTCRDASIKYTEGVNLEVIIDGFITSANVKVSEIEVVDGEFKNSDHNPVRMVFKLS